MKSSVVICVYTEERWEDIRAAVESVENQRRKPHEIILVVDYNPDLHLRLKREYPHAVVVENTQEKGLSGGKNTGAAIATGDIVAYLDDDAVAEPGWLEALEEGFQDPSVVGVGGLTRPLWASGRRPGWYPHEFDWTVGCTYRGMPTKRAPIRNVMGGNAAFRRQLVGDVGGFHTGIGRSVQGRKPRPLGCEETEFCIRLSQRMPGSIMLFEPRAVIGHKVPAVRATFAYFRSRCYAEGLSKALVTQSVGAGDGLASERAHALKALPLGALRGVGDALRGDPSGLGRAGAIVVGLAWTTWGYVVGSLRLKRVRS
ncbi:glycosyltransferase involved in cell wall biosynthesis [Streptosporangium becharense]|uniref:Glycosyltransferase involved in cell wall biosynthesis n=1 Tax=Streptosporangium becharense TaxID=1816182 RepID=A0A7W9IJD6_9ACTN|nr:glycosyltransferase family 2 protein [Streptosporangium becharense]MBB2911150.1 glycosyltransferase involved in cell wall biosynthesis [Streptosporangium becharense]MBB5821792.1 glycosyltransferase involved in cell wall biosynthesis [Streptosporangium becharense]